MIIDFMGLNFMKLSCEEKGGLLSLMLPENSCSMLNFIFIILSIKRLIKNTSEKLICHFIYKTRLFCMKLL
jgi:hypothetical protein